jgi:spore germination protein GerM
MFQGSLLWSLVGLVVVSLGAAACAEASPGNPSTSSVPNTSPTTVAVSTTPTQAAPTTTLGTTTTIASEIIGDATVQVWFASEAQSDCANVTMFERQVEQTAEPIEATFELLTAGPTRGEQAEGASSYFSTETTGMLRSVSLDSGLLTVDFDDLRPVIPNASTSCGSFSLIAELNETAFQFPEVERVTYQIEGSCDTFFNWLQRDCKEYSRT